MTSACEHCHYHEPEGDHLFLKILTMLVLAGMLWTIYQEIEDLNARVKKLENAPWSRQPRAKLEKVEDDT
jgi:hypothetical protein